MRSPEPSISPLTILDLLAILSIERRTNPSPWPLAAFLAELRAWRGCRLVARDDDSRVLGFVFGRLAGDELEVTAVAVAPEAQRHGLGRRLLTATLTRAAAAGAGCAHLEVRSRNIPARALYSGLGFREVGRRAYYYPDDRDDALLLRRALVAGESIR